MSLISKPVDWKVFNIPPIQPIQYYTILKKQREFSQLIKQYDAQVSSHGYRHYCTIVPKYSSSSFNNKYEIFVVFLDDAPTTSFIGFRIKVCKETFSYESKSLLLFLKNSEKAIFYSMNNNRIHVQCGTNAWELFYLLYHEYLKRYVLTIIGTQFFYHFVYSYCIEKEKTFSKLISKGSKVIRVNKSSVYYQIHRKRKISVTDLIHMTLNMPKRRKYTFSSFDFKESSLPSNQAYNDFYTVAGTKINISKLTLKKYKKEDIIDKKHEKLKRKFGEIKTKENLELDTSSKYPKLSESYSVDGNHLWKEYEKLESFSVENYSSISFINTLVPSILKNESPSYNSNLHSQNNSMVVKNPLSLKEDEMKNFAVVKKTSSKNHIEKEASGENIEKNCLNKNKSVTYSGYVVPKKISPHDSIFPRNNHETPSRTKKNNPNLTKNCDNFIHLSKNIDHNAYAFEASEDVNFITAGGKIINISSEAMLKAYKLCEKEVLPKKVISDVQQIVPEISKTDNIFSHKVPEKMNYADSIKKCVTKDEHTKISENEHSFIKADENVEKLTAADLPNIENVEDVTFSTAAGKTINVSNTAMEAAKKFICTAKDGGKFSLHNKNVPVQKNVFYKDDNISKADDVDMDNTLVEKFFEDVQFDEKEFELTQGNSEKDNLKVIFESKKDKSLPVQKPRKSLGGRRSMRYCSDKL